MWQNGIAPGQYFDTITPSPLLIKYIEEGKIPKGKALVPGCGRGYDVTALASADRLVTGLEISSTAMTAAQTRLTKLVEEEGYLYAAQTSFSLQNFFDLNPEKDDEKFDFVYDYTFLCALDPSLRYSWAQKMQEIIKPGGEVLTLIFPIVEKVGGPPFAVDLQLVKNLLEPAGFECVELDMLPATLCHPGRDGSEGSLGNSGIGRWRRL